MKVNFAKPFQTIRGENLTIDGRVQIIGDIIASSLYNGVSFKDTGDPMRDGARKLQAHSLAMRIFNAQEIEISTEEAVLIKEAVIHLTPGCYAQVVNIIENNA